MAIFRAAQFRHWLPVVLVALGLTLAGQQAAAETLQAANPAELQTLIDEAQRDGARIVVIEAPAQAATQAAPETTPAEPSLVRHVEARALEARARLREIIAQAGHFPARAEATLRAQEPDGNTTWPLLVVLFAVLFLAIGTVFEVLFRRWARPHFQHLFNPEPANDAEKIAYLLLRGGLQTVGVAIQITVALLLALAMDEGLDHLRNTHLIIFGAVATVRVLIYFFRNLLADDTPSHRLLAVSDDQARSLVRSLTAILVVAAVAGGTCAWMDSMDLDRNAHLLSLIGAMALTTLLMIAFTIRQRRAVANMILGADGAEEKPLPLRLLAQFWHVLAIVYFLAAWSVAATRLVLDLPNALGLVTGPILILFLAIAAYGVALLLIEWAFTPKPHPAAEVAAPSPDGEEPAASPPSDGFKELSGTAAAMIVAASAIWFVFDLWGIDLAAQGGLLHGLWEVLLVGFLAYLAFKSVKILIDRKIAEEGGIEEAELGEEGGAASSSRLATLLPLFRNFLFIVIAVIAGMIALSELGVDIAPLFAGAGVIGLAIGFGAQTMIRDIFSGAFFLMDDAFRKGEYIDIGGIKGTVEKISIRSMQLRHHMGALHTIPFGEIHHLTNYSRDWVMMKLPLRVPYDTDVERVRKLIKTLGKELLEHPEEGPKFVQPLKSQGVYKMEDSAMIIRVKYMTKPGDQFTTRKLVYAKVRELFEREGIKFAHRQVTVQVAGQEDGKPLTDEQKDAIAGAATSEDETLPKTGTAQR